MLRSVGSDSIDGLASEELRGDGDDFGSGSDGSLATDATDEGDWREGADGGGGSLDGR